MSQSFLPNPPFTEPESIITASRPELRQILLARRQQQPSDAAIAALNEHLHALLDYLKPRCLALYWPIRREFDPRPAIIQWSATHPEINTTLALPKAQTKNSVLCFSQWLPDTTMTRDAYGIAVPEAHIEVYPDLVLLPCLGFARENNHHFYRLGYGAGSYDRTLANYQAIRVGIAYEYAHLATIAPQAHDIPLDYMVTEVGCKKSGL